MHNIWTYRKWTLNKRTYTSPPITRGNNTTPVVTHKDKCETLREHLFPEPLTLPNEPEFDLELHETDLEYHSITKCETRDAIYTAAQLNTLGISGLTGRAWRWAWNTLEEEIFHLIRLCTDSGYHLKMWRSAIAVAIQKPNRDYSNPRSYRLIQLLEVLGKTLERIQARRLAYMAAKHNLFPSTQYGGISGRSAQDAIMMIIHNIEAAWNHNRAVTMLTFDITGFFDSIPHAYLINTLRDLRIPLPTVQWVLSFIQNRTATISLDGKQDTLSPIKTGVPQGSCASPILAAFFTAPMCKAVEVGTRRRIETLPELSSAIQNGKASVAPLTLYVDDSSIMASAQDRTIATKLVEIAFTEAHAWLTSRGLKTNQVKNELIHFTKSMRGRHAGTGPAATIPPNNPSETKTTQPAKVI